MSASMIEEFTEILINSSIPFMNNNTLEKDTAFEDYEFIFLLIFYILLDLLGIFGNITVCTVIARNINMHNATYYYLFSLAISDLIMLVISTIVSALLFFHWQPYPWGIDFLWCKLLSFLSKSTIFSSVLFILMVSIERYLSVFHPSHAHKISELIITTKIIGVLWIISFLCAIPFTFYSIMKFDEFLHDVYNSKLCANIETPENFLLFKATSIIFFVIPILIVIVLYTTMAIKTRNNTMFESGFFVDESSVEVESTNEDHFIQTQSTIGMLAVVVIIYFLCWSPFHIRRLFINYDVFESHLQWMYDHYLIAILYIFPSIINPIIYYLMSQEYRLGFKQTFCKTSLNNQEEISLSNITNIEEIDP